MHSDASGRVKSTGKGDFNPQKSPSSMRSARTYPSKKSGNSFPMPPANAANGGKTSGMAGYSGGTKNHPSNKSGNGFARPPATARRGTEGVSGQGGTGWLVGGVSGGRRGTDHPGSR